MASRGSKVGTCSHGWDLGPCVNLLKELLFGLLRLLVACQIDLTSKFRMMNCVIQEFLTSSEEICNTCWVNVVEHGLEMSKHSKKHGFGVIGEHSLLHISILEIIDYEKKFEIL